MAQRRKRPAVDVKVAYEKGGKVFARIKIGSPWLAAGIAGVSAVAVLYRENPEGVRTAVTNTLADFGEVLGVRRGSVLVDVRFHTKERFLAFMDAVAAGTVKQKLQERFSKLGLKVKLELTVTVYESASQMGIETPKAEKTTEEVSGSSRTPASLTVHFTLKDGTPSDSELQELAESISAKWMILGILLNIPQDVLDEIYTTEKNKPYVMLLRWKYETTSTTPYEDLYNALCHERVGLKNVAKRFCFTFTLKDGTPSDSELQVLAESISAKWMILGILLNIPQDVLDEIYAVEENKPYGMLLRWKYAATSTTPYEDLFNALCHERVGLNNLAKRFCSLEGSSTFPEPEASGKSSSKRPKLEASEESWSFAAPEASGRSSSKSPIFEALKRSLTFLGQEVSAGSSRPRPKLEVASGRVALKKKSFKK